MVIPILKQNIILKTKFILSILNNLVKFYFLVGYFRTQKTCYALRNCLRLLKNRYLH